MLETKRINDICPVCGHEFDLVNVWFKNGVAAGINADCKCGYTSHINETLDDKVLEEDVIDKWNRVHAE